MPQCSVRSKRRSAARDVEVKVPVFPVPVGCRYNVGGKREREDEGEERQAVRRWIRVRWTRENAPLTASWEDAEALPRLSGEGEAQWLRAVTTASSETLCASSNVLKISVEEYNDNDLDVECQPERVNGAPEPYHFSFEDTQQLLALAARFSANMVLVADRWTGVSLEGVKRHVGRSHPTALECSYRYHSVGRAVLARRVSRLINIFDSRGAELAFARPLLTAVQRHPLLQKGGSDDGSPAGGGTSRRVADSADGGGSYLSSFTKAYHKTHLAEAAWAALFGCQTGVGHTVEAGAVMREKSARVVKRFNDSCTSLLNATGAFYAGRGSSEWLDGVLKSCFTIAEKHTSRIVAKLRRGRVGAPGTPVPTPLQVQQSAKRLRALVAGVLRTDGRVRGGGGGGANDAVEEVIHSLQAVQCEIERYNTAVTTAVGNGEGYPLHTIDLTMSEHVLLTLSSAQKRITALFGRRASAASASPSDHGPLRAERHGKAGGAAARDVPDTIADLATVSHEIVENKLEELLLLLPGVDNVSTRACTCGTCRVLLGGSCDAAEAALGANGAPTSALIDNYTVGVRGKLIMNLMMRNEVLRPMVTRAGAGTADTDTTLDTWLKTINKLGESLGAAQDNCLDRLVVAKDAEGLNSTLGDK